MKSPIHSITHDGITHPVGEVKNLSAYYYNFEKTGVMPVDEILAKVASAGKAFHNTEEWNNDEYGASPVSKIQTAANQAAVAMATLQATCDRYKKALEFYADRENHSGWATNRIKADGGTVAREALKP